MADEGEKMPVRLVQENGDTISLDVTSVDIVVERAQSNFGIPFFNAKKMAIDVNQASLGIEVQGVLADDVGQETSSKATAKMEFYQPQSLVSWGSPIGGHSGGSTTTGPVSSGFNQTGSNVGAVSGATGIGGVSGGTGGFSGGFGGSGGEVAPDLNDLGNRILDHWHGKHIKFPVAKWTEAASTLDNPVSSGLQLWLKADSLSATYDDWDWIEAWTDSSNSRNAVQATVTNKPRYREDGVGGMPYVSFDGVDNYMAIPFNAFLNSEEFTILAVTRTMWRTGTLPIISTTNGTPGSSEQGFSLSVETASGKDAIATWNEGATTGSLTTTGSLVPKYNGHIIGYTMDDTTANGQADTVKIFVDGTEGATATTGVDYVPVSATADMYIGRHDSDYFHGGIYEILLYNRVLTTDERQQVEGYLSRKYSIKLKQTGHPYESMSSYNYHQIKKITVGFDKKMVGSEAEPYGFVNTKRNTGLTVTGSPSSGVSVFSVSGGDPRHWFELTENDRDMTIAIHDSAGNIKLNSGGDAFYGTVTAVAASTITVTWSETASTIALSNNDKVYMERVLYGNSELCEDGNESIIIIPIKNADTYVATQDAEKAVGPEFPAYQDGSARDTGGGITRTDEYITYLFSKALTSSYLTVGNAVNTAGDKTMNKAFSVVIGEGSNGHNTHLTITQEYASSLGQLSDAKLETNLGIGQMPISPGFTGGKSGKRVKSGGDKTQDILGILGNSANFTEIPDKNFVTDILGFGLNFVQNTVYSGKDKGDFIRGIQIPYNTLATKGKSAFDAEVAQRNFFATTAGNTSDKISSANTLHASQLFSHTQEGYMKNGISGLVTDFNVHRDAEMKAYEFSLKFVAADIIL